MQSNCYADSEWGDNMRERGLYVAVALRHVDEGYGYR